MINTSLLCWRNFPSAAAIPDSATNSPATPIVMNRPPSIVNTCIHAKAGPFRLLCPVLAIMAPYSRINPNGECLPRQGHLRRRRGNPAGLVLEGADACGGRTGGGRKGGRSDQGDGSAGTMARQMGGG